MNAASESIIRQVAEVNHSDGQAIGDEHVAATKKLLGEAIESEEFQIFALGVMEAVATNVEAFGVNITANMMRMTVG